MSSLSITPIDPHPGAAAMPARPAPARRSPSLFANARTPIPGVPALQSELTDLQNRLGTASERPGDLTRVREVAHKLNNLLCVALLRDQLARLERIDYGAATAA